MLPIGATNAIIPGWKICFDFSWKAIALNGIKMRLIARVLTIS
jgi:hypothetical protein